MVGPGVFQLPTKLTPPRNSRSQESHLVAIARRLFAVVRFTCQLVAKAHLQNYTTLLRSMSIMCAVAHAVSWAQCL